MAAFVIDVNVAIAANGKSEQANPACVLACIKALQTARRGLICIDQRDRILKEYRVYLSLSGQPGVGDEFMQWLCNNQYNPEVCEQVCITESAEGDFCFQEFPDDPDLRGFDPSDQKYVAVAWASRHHPQILNATDSDWRDFQIPLKKNEVQVKQLCPDCLRMKC